MLFLNVGESVQVVCSTPHSSLLICKCIMTILLIFFLKLYIYIIFSSLLAKELNILELAFLLFYIKRLEGFCNSVLRKAEET